MSKCSSYPNLTCIGVGGNCERGCLHAKKDREDEERDNPQRKESGKIGFWGWFFIVLIVAYVLGQG